MNELLNRIAEADPDFAKSLRRNQILSYAFAVAALLAIGGAAWAIGVNFNQGKDITQVQRSACQEKPAGRDCQRSKRQSDKARTVRDTCIAFWRVGYPCPAPNSGVTVRSIQGGDASQPAQAGQPPSPAEAGGEHGQGAHKGTQGGTRKPPKSRDAPSHAEPEPPSADTSPAETEAETPAPGNSGNGASAEHGLNVCVELVKSACVKTDVELP